MTNRWDWPAWLLALLFSILAAVGWIVARDASRNPSGVPSAAFSAAINSWFFETYGTPASVDFRYDVAPKQAPVTEHCKRQYEPSGPRVFDGYFPLKSPFGDFVIERARRDPDFCAGVVGSTGWCGGEERIHFACKGEKFTTFIDNDPKENVADLKEYARTWHVGFRGDYKSVYDDIVTAVESRSFFRPLGFRIGDPSIEFVAWSLALLYTVGMVLFAQVMARSKDNIVFPFAEHTPSSTVLVVLAVEGWIVMGLLLMTLVASHKFNNERIGILRAVLEFSAILALTLAIAKSVWRLFLGIGPAQSE